MKSKREVLQGGDFFRGARHQGRIRKHLPRVVNTGHVDSKISDSREKSYPIPDLSTVDAMVDAIKSNFPTKIDFSKVAIVAVQHNLETTVTLYKALQKLGIKKIYTLGKCYSDSLEIVQAMKEHGIQLIPSTIPEQLGQYRQAAKSDVDKLWETCLKDIENSDIDTITVLDDGGRCLAGMPLKVPVEYKVAGIEQTLDGLYIRKIKDLLYPIIDVASSAIKRWVEPPFIAKDVIRKVTAVLKEHGLMHADKASNKKIAIGVAGVGAIGSAIVKHLLGLGYRVNIYDADENAIKKAKLDGAIHIGSFKTFVANSQCIFGCTGEDLTKNLPKGISLADIVEHDTVIVSCSSEDKEFRGELEKIAQNSRLNIQDHLSAFTASSNNKSEMIFVRGGFPVHFDREPWNVPADEIEPTQASLLGAVFQATLAAKRVIHDGVTRNHNSVIMLDPNIQKFILETRCKFKTAKENEQAFLSYFRNIEWIRSESGVNNIYQENWQLAECFNKPEAPAYAPALRSRL